MSASILRKAHGAAAGGGTLLVAETPPIDELDPLNAGDTEAGLAMRRVRGRPFQPGNRAAADRGPSLTRINAPNTNSEAIKRLHRKAGALKRTRERELAVQHGGERPSTAVRVELVAWAKATAWAEFLESQSVSPLKVAQLREKASAHQLKAIAIAEREAAARSRQVEALEPWIVVEASPSAEPAAPADPTAAPKEPKT